MCSWTKRARSAGSATRRRRPRASNPPRRTPRRDLGSFPRDLPEKIAARPRDAPRGRPVFASRRPAPFAFRRARQLGGQLARPRPPDRAHAPSTVRRHLYNSVRLDRRWGPLGVVPIKLAVFLPAAVLDLGGLLSNRSGTTPMEASVAAVAMSALVAIMAVFIFFPNAASHYLRRTRKDGGCVSWLVHPFVGEVTLWACVLATEIGFSRLAAEAVTRWATRDGYGFVSGTEGSPDRSRLGSLDTGTHSPASVTSLGSSTRAGSDDETLPSLLFPLLNWVAVGFLSPLMSCELYCVGVGVDSHDSLVGGFGPVAWIHALSRVATATWLCTGWGGSIGRGGLSPVDSTALCSLATMSVVKTCVASFMAHASWCRRRAQYTDSSTMRGFLAYLSHECRVPLQVVLAGLEVLSGGGSVRGGIAGSGTLEDCDSDTGASGGPMTRSRGKRHGGNHGVGHRNGHHDESVHALGGPEGYATHVRAMRMAAQSIHDVLNDTLDLHKYVLTGKISMTPRRFDFIRAAWETVEEARVAEIGARNGGSGGPRLDLAFEASPDAEAELRWVRETLRAREFGDEQRLRQVLMNLVSNGIRHTPAGGAVRVTVASAVAVRIEDDTSASSLRSSGLRSSNDSNDSNASLLNDASPSHDAGGSTGSARRRRKSRHSHADDDETEEHVGLVTLSVHVTDTGAGILARDKRYIFTPYGRGEGGGQGSANGADGGIGLALSQLIVGQHGGKIDISSEAGVGSTFSMEITLPLVRDPAMEDDAADGRTPSSRAPHHRRHQRDHKPSHASPPAIHDGGHPGWNGIRRGRERTPPSADIFASALYSGADARDVADLRSDIARRETRCRDGSDRAPRINMRRPSWEGQRTPRPSRTSPTTSDEAPDTIHEGRVAAHHAHSPPFAAMQVDRPRRVLLVDDDRLVRMVLAALLRRMDAVCVTASDGAEAVNKCASGEFDLVIMDLRMPVMDGLEATRRIREMDADVPIVGLTANTMPEDTARFLRSGANEVIYKPINADNVEKLLSRYSNYSSSSPTNSHDGGVPAAMCHGFYETM